MFWRFLGLSCPWGLPEIPCTRSPPGGRLCPCSGGGGASSSCPPCGCLPTTDTMVWSPGYARDHPLPLRGPMALPTEPSKGGTPDPWGHQQESASAAPTSTSSPLSGWAPYESRPLPLVPPFPVEVGDRVSAAIMWGGATGGSERCLPCHPVPPAPWPLGTLPFMGGPSPDPPEVVRGQPPAGSPRALQDGASGCSGPRAGP